MVNIDIDHVTKNFPSVLEWILSWFNNLHNVGVSEQTHWRNTLKVGCWFIWKYKCECIFQDKTLNLSCTVSRINFHFHNFNMSMNLVENSLDSNSIVLQEDTHLHKVYVDTSFDHFT